MCANIVNWKVDFAQGRSQSSQVPQLPWMWSSKWVGEPDCWTSFGDILKHSKTFGRHTWRTRWQDSRWRVSCKIQYESIFATNNIFANTTQILLLKNFYSRCVINLIWEHLSSAQKLLLKVRNYVQPLAPAVCEHRRGEVKEDPKSTVLTRVAQ